MCYPDNPCENNGVCKSDGHNIVCKCHPGFLGDHCEGKEYIGILHDSNDIVCRCPPGSLGIIGKVRDILGYHMIVMDIKCPPEISFSYSFQFVQSCSLNPLHISLQR